jgi:hypothetical protein
VLSGEVGVLRVIGVDDDSVHRIADVVGDQAEADQLLVGVERVVDDGCRPATQSSWTIGNTAEYACSLTPAR